MKLRILAGLAGAALLAAVTVAFAADPAPPSGEPTEAAGPTAIRWARKPDGDVLGRIVPNGMDMQGGKGRATLVCVMSGNGWLRQCRVAEETSKGVGLAALGISLFFKFEPVHPGADIGGREMRVPITFDGGGAAEHNLIASSIWLKAPSPAQVAAAYPAGKTGDGRVLFECQLNRYGGLDACRPRLSDPEAAGWVAAARQLLPEFKAPLQAQGGVSTQGARVLVPVQLLDPRSPELQDSPIGNRPMWSRTPDSADMAYPAAARAKGLRSGRGDVDCKVGADGGLIDCRIVREAPEGAGFGEAALRVAGKFALSTWSFDGRPVEGYRIRLPIGFVDDQAAAAPAQ